MKKLLFLSLLAGALIIASPALAKENGGSFWAAASRLVQEIFEPEEIFEEEIMDEDFVDPKEVQQVLREIKDQKRELTRLAKQIKKLPGGNGILSEISALLEQVAGFESSINEGLNLRDTIQEFRDAQLWEELNKIRAKVEIPRELAQWNKEIKRLETLLKQKKYQNMGLDLTMARSKIDEIKATLSRVQEFYNSGDFESAMEEFDGLRQDFHPGEIMNVIQRMQELTNRLKAVKNAEVKEKVKEAFSEVVSNFNEGEFRIARELMDESWNDIMQMINQALSVGKKKGASRQNILQMTDKIQNQMKNKAEEKREQNQQQFQPQEIQPQFPERKSAPRQESGGIFQQPVRQPAEQGLRSQPGTEPEFRPQPQLPPTETIRTVEPTPVPVIEAKPALEPTR